MINLEGTNNSFNPMIGLQAGSYSGQILNSKNAEGFIVGRTVYCADSASSPWHYHENAHVTFLLKGGCIEYGEDRQVHQRKAGDVVFMRSGQAHQITTSCFPSENINLEIRNPYLSNADIDENKCDKSLAFHPYARTLLIQLYQESLTVDRLEASTAMIVLDLLGSSSPGTFAINKPQWLNIIEERLKDQWQSPPTLDELSVLTQMHPVTVSKYFHKYKKQTLSTYIRRIKIEQAIKLIGTTDMTMTEVAFHCGFADQSHLIKTFQKHTGLSPLRFKRI